MRQLFKERLTSDGVRAFMRNTNDEVRLVADPEWFDSEECYNVIVELVKIDLNVVMNALVDYDRQLKGVDYSLYTEEVVV